MTINVCIGKEKITIPYSIGVQQGDNMAPVLFIFVMLAFTDILEKNWSPTWGITPIQFKRHSPTTSYGRLIAQDPDAIGEKFDLFNLLYVDDGTFLFNLREELEKGAQMISNTFKLLGLTMHVGTGESKSKSEAMYISPSFKHDNSTENNTAPISLTEGTISFCTEFKYLGSIITNDMTDENEIIMRIKKANMQFGALKQIFSDNKVKLSSKFLLYKSIILNTVLWRCESWTLNVDSKRRLESFQNNIIRRILRISKHNVQHERITNTQIKNRFYNIPSIIKIIKARQLKWLGKITLMKNDRMPKKLLASWTNNHRKNGRPQLNIRNSYADALSQVLLPPIK